MSVAGHVPCPPFDCCVYCPPVLSTAAVAADFVLRDVAPLVLVSGGIGHSTSYLVAALAHNPATCTVTSLPGTTEADMLADVITSVCGVPRTRVLLESLSTNCGQNAEFSREVLRKLSPNPRRILLIQDPTMQRRSRASFERWWQDADGPVVIDSWSPFVPRISLRLTTGSDSSSCVECYLEGALQPVEASLHCDGLSPSDMHSPTCASLLTEASPLGGAWSAPRLLGLLLGELPRLRDGEGGYGPRGRGFIAHVDIPASVEDAWAAAAAAFPQFIGR